MSSNDRTNRFARQQPYQPGDDEVLDDSIVFDDAWHDAPPADDVISRSTSVPSRSPLTRPAADGRAAPQYAGTAAQIDQLRRNLGRSNRRQETSLTGEPVPIISRGRPERAPQEPRPRRNDDAVISRRAPSRPAIDPKDFATGQTTRPAADTQDFAPGQASRRSSQPRRESSFRPQPTTPAVDPYVNDRYAPDDAYPDDYDYDDSYAYDDGYEDDFGAYDEPTRPSRTVQRPQVNLPAFSKPSLPPAIANAAIVSDTTSLGIIGVSIAGLAAMAILVANQVDSLAPGFATHVSASGLLERVQDESALWRLPLLATMATLMNIVIAWFVAPIDRFAARFALVASIVIQLVVWIALIKIL